VRSLTAWGLQHPQVWRVLPKGRSDILFLVASDLQTRQAEVAKHDRLRKRTARAGSKRILRGPPDLPRRDTITVEALKVCSEPMQ